MHVDESSENVGKKSEHRWQLVICARSTGKSIICGPFEWLQAFSFFTIVGNKLVTVAVRLQFEALHFLTRVFARDANGKSIFVATVSANNRV